MLIWFVLSITKLKNTDFLKKIINHQFFKELDIKSSTVLILGLFAFAVIFIDLTSDLASEKDEITVVIATLNKIDNPDTAIAYSGLDIPACDNIVILQNVSINQTDVIKLHPDRAPPKI